MALENIKTSETPHSAPPPMDEFQIAGILEKLIKFGLFHATDKPLKQPLLSGRPFFMTDDKDIASDFGDLLYDVDIEPGNILDAPEAMKRGILDLSTYSVTPEYEELLQEIGRSSHFPDLAFSPEFKSRMDKEGIDYLLDPKSMSQPTPFSEPEYFNELVSMFPEKSIRSVRRR
tara:strand:+ start:587 stop:1108 length:522 start_codon:yes stop_codon:yes gene_type:complete